MNEYRAKELNKITTTTTNDLILQVWTTDTKKILRTNLDIKQEVYG
jgi:hypothetical protein